MIVVLRWTLIQLFDVGDMELFDMVAVQLYDSCCTVV